MSILAAINSGKYDNKVKFSSVPEQRRAWRAEESAIEQRFRADLEVEFGMKGHAKADLLWRMAWDRGHSSGLQEVFQEYRELSELVKP